MYFCATAQDVLLGLKKYTKCLTYSVKVTDFGQDMLDTVYETGSG